MAQYNIVKLPRADINHTIYTQHVQHDSDDCDIGSILNS
jgi:hypothetical protein